MNRSTKTLGILAAVATLLLASNRSDAQGDKWGTIKGQVAFGGDKIPPRKVIDVKTDANVCLATNPTADLKAGTILDEAVLINPKNKGLKNVMVWLMNDPKNPLPIHPNLMKFPQDVVIDQPTCMFFPRAVAMREGQVVVVKNSAAIQHNIR